MVAASAPAPNPMLASALDYAARGVPVFPLAPGSKIPRKDSAGFKDATTDPEQIRAWWTQEPRANIGMPTGEASGRDAIDEDPRNGGDAGPLCLPPTLTVYTPSGGRHFHYLHPGGYLKGDNTGKVAPGIDVKASGGYVVLPPSVVDGKPYRWEDEAQPLAEMPARIAVRLMTRETVKRPASARHAAPGGADDSGTHWLGKALDKAHAGASRNDTGAWLAEQLRDAGLSESDAEPFMSDYAERAPSGEHPYTVREALATLRSIYSRPAREPARALHALPSARRSESNQDAGEDSDDAPAPAAGEKEAQQDVLIRLGGSATFFRTPRGTLHAAVEVHGRREVYNLPERGGDFRAWLVNAYGKMHGRAPSTTAITQALEFFRARARFDGEVHEVYTRLAYHAGKLYLDLGSETWECIEVDASGWRIIEKPPVYFRRTEGTGALPYPQRDGSLAELRPFVNVKSDDQWRLVLAWVLGTLHPAGPYAHCEMTGPQGSAKTSATRYLRAIVDPGTPPVRRAPKDADDFMIAASNSWILALDNLSSIPDWLSDLLATLATGAGSGTRTKYTDAGETIFDAKRPAIFNGITDLATRGDLQERTVRIELQPLPTGKGQRKTETAMNTEYAKAQPRILGALLEAVSCALRRLPVVSCDALPRMADFAQWVTAAEPALGWEDGTFLRIFGANQADSAGTVLDADPIARAVVTFMEDKTRWQGLASELHMQLAPHAPHGPDAPNWPKAAHTLVGRLRRSAPAVAVAGITIETERKRDGSHVTISKTPPCDASRDDEASQASREASHIHPRPHADGDACDACDASSPVSLPYYNPPIKTGKKRENRDACRDEAERASQASQRHSDQPDKHERCGSCGASMWGLATGGNGYECKKCGASWQASA